ncbi:MAG TPA: uroporphyrinogen-III synthase [Chloroflexota bacterium]|nr:uroporphyrinogen-III synthase [Chloroflexota bacterium]
MADLAGRVVAFLASRRAAELGDLIARHRGVPYPVPCLREVHRPEAPELARAVEALCSDRVGVVLFLTGVGTQTLLDAARLQGREQQLRDALARKRIAVRGPKPLAVLQRAGVRVDLRAPAPYTSAELLAALDAWDLRGVTVAVQLYGGPNPALRAGLEQRGARVLEIAPYVWERPTDPGPVLELIAALEAGRVDVLAATSAAQVENLFAIAREHGREAALRAALARVPVAAQGPVCAAAFAREGIAVAILPAHPHLAPLVRAIADYFTPAAAGIQTDA